MRARHVRDPGDVMLTGEIIESGDSHMRDPATSLASFQAHVALQSHIQPAVAVLAEQGGSGSGSQTASPSVVLAAHLAPLDLNISCTPRAPIVIGATTPASPAGMSKMISVASSLLELSNPSGMALRSGADALPRSPQLVGAAASLGALATARIPPSALPPKAMTLLAKHCHATAGA